MRLGLPPFDDLKNCICGTPIAPNSLHFLSCHYLRSSILLDMIGSYNVFLGFLGTVDCGAD